MAWSDENDHGSRWYGQIFSGRPSDDYQVKMDAFSPLRKVESDPCGKNYN
jgi:hypothetical protein